MESEPLHAIAVGSRTRSRCRRAASSVFMRVDARRPVVMCVEDIEDMTYPGKVENLQRFFEDWFHHQIRNR